MPNEYDPKKDISRLAKQLWEEEGGPDAHGETHEETIKLLADLGDSAVPELLKWASFGNGPGNKRCADLAGHLEGKKEIVEEEKVMDGE